MFYVIWAIRSFTSASSTALAVSLTARVRARSRDMIEANIAATLKHSENYLEGLERVEGTTSSATQQE